MATATRLAANDRNMARCAWPGTVRTSDVVDAAPTTVSDHIAAEVVGSRQLCLMVARFAGSCNRSHEGPI